MGETENLLIVSAPRERLLLGILALFVISVGAWLIVGGVERTVEFDGLVYRVEPEEPMRVALRAPPELAELVSAGMAARVDVAMPGETTLELRGEVLALPVEPPPRLAERLPRAADGARHIDVGLQIAGETIPPELEGAISRVSILLGRQSIAELLSFRP